MLTREEFSALSECLTRLHGEVGSVAGTLASRLPSGSPAPAALNAWLNRLMDLRHRLERGSFTFPAQLGLPPDDMAFIRTAVALSRRRAARHAEESERFFLSPDVREGIGKSTAILDRLLAEDLATIVPVRRPRLGDYLTVEGLEQSGALGAFSDRERDPKHRILLSSALLPRDLAVLRTFCEERGVKLGVLFADLDNFKAVNTALGEVAVDRTVLPQVLGRVEAVAFGHGYSYRFGGDEFVVLLPNTSEEQALLVAKAMSDGIAQLVMPPNVKAVRASIGVWIADGESHLTENELVHKASEGKQRAKDLGRNRIVLRSEMSSAFTEQRSGFAFSDSETACAM